MERPVIVYLSPFDLLRPRTNQVSDVRFSEGFSQEGCEVHIIAPYVQRPDNIDKHAIASVYGLERPPYFHYLPVTFKKDIKGHFNAALIALLDTLKILSIRRKFAAGKKMVIISRHSALLLPLSILKLLLPFLFRKTFIIHWSHDLKTKWSDRMVYSNSAALFFTNSSIRDSLLKTISFPAGKTAITLNPITEKQATEQLRKEDARKEAGLTDIKTPLVVYTGKLGLKYQQEIIHILEAAAECTEATFLLTGGSPNVVAFWQQFCTDRNISNVRFTGYLTNYTDIRYYQYSADILITYYTRQGHDPRYNLPNKICEYMLTGNVIISPDYPASADLLHQNNCLFCTPESSQELAKVIRYAIAHPEICHEKAAVAAREVREITFRKQANRLLAFIQDLL